MILLLGDIHGNVHVLKAAIRKAVQEGATAVIQVGDFGLMQGKGIDASFYNATKDSPIPVYFIEGNHDDCTRWIAYEEVSRVWHDANLWYVPRGTVTEIDGRTIAFMGGAASIDKQYRLNNNMHWDENELLTEGQINKLLISDRKVDMFITHCPPDSVVEEHFNPVNKLYFGVGLDWIDPTQKQIENIWHVLGTPMIYSGHMHRTVKGEAYRILDINEMLLV